jgi:methylated-DNA-[protein]-cysteine S-methyltransferase
MGAVKGAGGLVRVVLPHYSVADLKALLAFEHTGSVEDLPAFAELVALTQAYFRGEKADFGAVACVLPPESAYYGKVYRACRAIPYGQTRSYTALATILGNPEAARAVALAMAKNPLPLVVPCHRVVAAGDLGGFSAPGGVGLKKKMLTLEKAI